MERATCERTTTTYAPRISYARIIRLTQKKEKLEEEIETAWAAFIESDKFILGKPSRIARLEEELVTVKDLLKKAKQK